MIFSEDNTKIAAALAKAWGVIENPKHNTSVKVKMKSGGQYSFEYTDLNGIFDEAKRVFKENGISVIQNAYTETGEGKTMVSVETMLLHSSGQFVKSLPLKFAAQSSMQDMGGQITYMKRYSLSAMLGIATEKDDDANGASGNETTFQNKSKAKQGDQPNKATTSQKGTITKNVKEFAALRNQPSDKVYSALSISDLQQITKEEASRALATLDGWLNKAKEKQEESA